MRKTQIKEKKPLATTKHITAPSGTGGRAIPLLVISVILVAIFAYFLPSLMEEKEKIDIIPVPDGLGDEPDSLDSRLVKFSQMDTPFQQHELFPLILQLFTDILRGDELHAQRLEPLLRQGIFHFLDESERSHDTQTAYMVKDYQSGKPKMYFFTPFFNKKMLQLSVQHEAVHASLTLRNNRLQKSGCRLSENTYKETLAYAAPFYPFVSFQRPGVTN